MKEANYKNRKNGKKGALVRIVIADDNQQFIKNTRRLLDVDSQLSIIAEANNGKEVISLVQELNPDLVLMDIQMPEINGLEATSVLKRGMPELKVIVSTLLDLEEYRRLATDSGADSFVLKKDVYGELIPEIYRLMELDD